MVFLGADVTRVRLREALAAVGVSKKQAKRLEKQHREFLAATRGDAGDDGNEG